MTYIYIYLLLQTTGSNITFGVRCKVYEYIENVFAVWLIIAVQFYPHTQNYYNLL